LFDTREGRVFRMNELEFLAACVFGWLAIGAAAVAVGIDALSRWGQDNSLLWLTAIGGPFTAMAIMIAVL